jgi:hypothetical protein
MLLRFDKNSRKKGKYAPMERTLFAKFKKRRARARKTTTKWLVHTARHVMRNDYPDYALDFKGSKGWVQRFKRRFNIVTRKKTNVKNTTWEETEPKLQAYFRTFRRRLRDPVWWEQYGAAATATPARRQADAVEPDGAIGDELRRGIVRREAEERRIVEAEADAIGAALAARVVASALASGVDGAGSPRGSPCRAHPPPRAASPDVPLRSPPRTAPPEEPLRSSPRKRSRDGEDPLPRGGCEDGRSVEEADLPWWKRGQGKWGKYLDFQRLNVDQVRLLSFWRTYAYACSL